ncbi:hypothetical protein BLNAU_1086 [Blattamonas nauphoetae]|uniref:Uncharacterized protein n=1 Tax=Blattamonas nauphoetae TaxID=2049346 RepID=A0ABQ9YJR7_9EUKA|nr:hypothetical protein BLNAU_1086 [Blattamonas nauphoetae]
MNKIPISILDTQDILTVLNTFSFQHPFPQLRKAQCFPPSQAVKKEHICILVDQAPLPHVFTPLSPNLAFPCHQSFSYDWRLVNVNDNPTFPSDKDLKTLVEPAFRACVPLFPIPHRNNNKNVVLCGHSTDDIVTHRFLTSSVVDQSWIDTYIFAVITSGAPFGALTINILTRDRASLHWMIPNKNTFDDDCVVVRLISDNVCKIIMKNMTWTDNKAGKACVKTAVQRTRNNTDQPLVLPKVMTHVMYSIGINATAGVILNATSQRWSSDTHSDYYMDGEGTVPTVSLSSILQDAVPIALKRSHALGPADQVKQALSAQSTLPPLSSNIKTLQMLLPINEKLETSMHSVVEETFVSICDLSQGTTDEKIHLVKPPTLPVLICLLEHPSMDITHEFVTTLHNIILAGALMIPDNESHTVFDKKEDSGNLPRILQS